MSAADSTDRALAPSTEELARELCRRLEADAETPPLGTSALQELLVAVVGAYGADAEGRAASGATLAGSTAGARLSPSDVAITVAELLRAADVTTFEVAAMFDV